MPSVAASAAIALLQLIDLGRQRHRIGGVALKYFNGDGTAVRSTEQAVDDLQRAPPAVSAIAAFGQRTATTFHVARRDVIQHQRPAAEMTFGQHALDGRLTFQQPVQCGVEFVFVDLAEAEHFAQARGGRGRRQPTSGGELGCRIEDPGKQKGEHKVTTTVAVRTKDTIETELARRAEAGGDVTVW